MKKILTIVLVMLLVVGGSPLAFADNGDDTKPYLVKAQQLKANWQERKQETTQDIEEAKHNYLEAKQYYQEKRNQLQEKKEKLEQMKPQWQECQDSGGDDCLSVKEEFLGYGKEYAIHSADALIKYLDQVYNKIKLDEDLTMEETDEQLNEIRAQMDKVNGLKEIIDNATTKEELEGAVDELRALLQEIKPTLQHRVTNLYKNRIGQIIVRAEQLEVKLDKILDRAGESGYDTGELSKLINNFNELVASARDKYYDSQEILEDFHGKDTELVREAHALLKAAHQDLSSAQKILRDILHEIKGITGEGDDGFINETETCWEDRPDYRPGYDLGYFIWQANCKQNTWFVDWSGDSLQESTLDEVPAGYLMEGTIKVVDGEFFNVGIKAFEQFDTFEWTDNEIKFKAWVGPHFDGIHFQSTSNVIEFDLYVDGEYQEDLVYIGKDWENPAGIPFKLEGKASIMEEFDVICEEGQLFIKNECVDEIEEVEIEESDNNGIGKKYNLAIPTDIA
ncbi:MAG: hypothetical protein ABIJ20_00940 [Nanoarchaeota archaeon]|nr:hypothetical protein [Nanoarchaeota archaeon]MBU1444721.1 hypothetical protein [Nanoarchaeota archaeon]MBU2406884.1 hypothetical protein [Nanoarchaeota archaeon]MBU2420783.1 hypothetical protein [Nanoarchaeota archaeon]MBU2475380.1 hypothetical protein [Nanoarchaeota archaeon]